MSKTIWLIPCNPKLFNVTAAFANLPSIDWRQSTKVNAGDVVYIYCGLPYSKIMYKTVATKTYIPKEEMDTSDTIYDLTDDPIGITPKFGYMRLQMIKHLNIDELHLNTLVEHGLKKAPQGPLKMKDSLLAYVENIFENNN